MRKLLDNNASKQTGVDNPGQIDIEVILSQNDLSEYGKRFQKDLTEYGKRFKKKKLTKMEQIQHYSEEEFKKLGIKKLGHLKRILRVTKLHFSQKLKP